MKKLLLLTFYLFLATSLQAQFNTSFQMGTTQTGTKFGYKMGKLCPYAGLSLNNRIESVNWVYGVNITDRKDISNIIGLDLGLKLAVYEGEKVTAWVDVGANKDFRFNKEFEDGVLQEDDNDKYVFWGSGMAFHVEYFFNEHISLGTAFKIGWSVSDVLSEDVQRDRYTLSRTVENYTQSLLFLNFYF